MTAAAAGPGSAAGPRPGHHRRQPHHRRRHPARRQQPDGDARRQLGARLRGGTDLGRRRRHRRPLRDGLPGRGDRPPARGRRRHRRHPVTSTGRPSGTGSSTRPTAAGTGSTGRRPAASAEVAPQPGDIPAAWLDREPAPVVHVAAMPLAAASRRRPVGPRPGTAAPPSRWTRTRAGGEAPTCSTPRRLVDVFLPSREELAELAGLRRPAPRGRRADRGRGDMRRGQDGRRRRAGGQAGHAAGARTGQQGSGRGSHRRRRQLLRRRSPPGSRWETTSSAPPGGAARRPPPRSGRPARCGCWTSARSPATCSAAGSRGNEIVGQAPA